MLVATAADQSTIFRRPYSHRTNSRAYATELRRLSPSATLSVVSIARVKKKTCGRDNL